VAHDFTINLTEIGDALMGEGMYFGRQISGIQANIRRYGHMSELVRFVCEHRDQAGPVKILEIGSWIGASAITWGRAIEAHNGGKGQVICVDPWSDLRTYRDTGVPYQDMMNLVHEHEIAWRLFHHNIKASGLSRLVHAFRGPSEKVLPDLPRDSFDIVFVDGDHLCDAVMVDIGLATPLVKEGGFLCGDDLELQAHEVDRAEMYAAVEQRVELIRDSASGTIYHPGVALALAKMSLPVVVTDGFWYAQRDGAGWALQDIASRCPIPDHVTDWTSRAAV
jgi:predicted O-methyltransferase YrrM